MKTLLLMRHAKSSWSDARLADHDRPLNKRGKRDAPRIGKLLLSEDLVPDLIIASTARRAKSTAEAVALASGFEEEIAYTRMLYHAGPEDYLDVIGQIADSARRVMLIGHNPGMEEFLADLTGVQERLPTAALAQISLPFDQWRQVSLSSGGTLVNLWRARELPF